MVRLVSGRQAQAWCIVFSPSSTSPCVPGIVEEHSTPADRPTSFHSAPDREIDLDLTLANQRALVDILGVSLTF
jgi:hypothetical protein